jgi:hypothetical protein
MAFFDVYAEINASTEAVTQDKWLELIKPHVVGAAGEASYRGVARRRLPRRL